MAVQVAAGVGGRLRAAVLELRSLVDRHIQFIRRFRIEILRDLLGRIAQDAAGCHVDEHPAAVHRTQALPRFIQKIGAAGVDGAHRRARPRHDADARSDRDRTRPLHGHFGQKERRARAGIDLGRQPQRVAVVGGDLLGAAQHCAGRHMIGGVALILRHHKRIGKLMDQAHRSHLLQCSPYR